MAMFLPAKKAEKIDEATLTILERTGIKLEHAEAIEILLEAGATKDSEARILIPRSLVKNALAKAKRIVQLYTRDGESSISLNSGRTFFGPGSDALYNIDRSTGSFRFSTLDDVRENARIADAMTEFDFVMSMALPSDVETHLYPTVFAAMVQNTTKPIVATATSLDDIGKMYHIACIVAGGEQEFRDRPFFVAYLEPNSPLHGDRSSIERLLFCAEHDIPFLYAGGANIGAAAPVNLAAAVAQGNAESLFGLVLASLKNEIPRFILSSNSSSVDMICGKVLYGAPEWFKTVAMYADMGRYYGLPTWGTAGCSDAQCIDAQAGFEAYEGILLGCQSGPTMVHNVGYLSYGFLYDARMLVLTNELIRRARWVTAPVETDNQQESLQVVDEVARGYSDYGSFLDHPHTAREFRKNLWLPPWFIQRGLPDAEVSMQQELNEKLSSEVSTILSNHQVRSLASGKKAEIDRFLGMGTDS
jgi:trimethylamine--corrinoid protein Co-methyltransferase